MGKGRVMSTHGSLTERLRVVLVEPEGEINVGSIARLIKNFGVREFYIVNPKARLNGKAREFAAKAIDVLEKAIICSSLDEALKDVDVSICTSAIVGDSRDVLRHPITPKELASIVGRYNKVALVFGRESTGLTRDEIGKCDLLLTIPANPEYPTLNLSHAVGILLYEVYVAEHTSPLYEIADRNVLELIMKYVEDIVRVFNEDERKASRILASFRRILYKSLPSIGEAYNLLYLVRKIDVMLRECKGER